MADNVFSNLRKLKAYIQQERRRIVSVAYYRDHLMNHPGDYNSIHAFDYYKCIFIHIPKSAGTSVAKSLFGNKAMSHMNYDWYVKNMGRRTVDKYFKFCFVRNPWDRLYSAYVYLKKGGNNEFDADFSKKYLEHINSFDQFVMEWLNEETMNIYWHFMPQYKFVTSFEKPDKIMVDFVGKFENIQTDFAHICEALNQPDKILLKENRTPDKDFYAGHYNAEMRDKVNKLYEKDVLLFNYSFTELSNK